MNQTNSSILIPVFAAVVGIALIIVAFSTPGDQPIIAFVGGLLTGFGVTQFLINMFMKR